MKEGIEQNSETSGGGYSYYLVLNYQYRIISTGLDGYENREKSWVIQQ